MTILRPQFESGNVKWIDVMSDFTIIYSDENHRTVGTSPNKITVRNKKFRSVARYDAKWMKRIGFS
jgi:hypothetical protein